MFDFTDGLIRAIVGQGLADQYAKGRKRSLQALTFQIESADRQGSPVTLHGLGLCQPPNSPIETEHARKIRLKLQISSSTLSSDHRSSSVASPKTSSSTLSTDCQSRLTSSQRSEASQLNTRPWRDNYRFVHSHFAAVPNDLDVRNRIDCVDTEQCYQYSPLNITCEKEFEYQNPGVFRPLRKVTDLDRLPSLDDNSPVWGKRKEQEALMAKVQELQKLRAATQFRARRRWEFPVPPSAYHVGPLFTAEELQGELDACPIPSIEQKQQTTRAQHAKGCAPERTRGGGAAATEKARHMRQPDQPEKKNCGLRDQKRHIRWASNVAQEPQQCSKKTSKQNMVEYGSQPVSIPQRACHYIEPL